MLDQLFRFVVQMACALVAVEVLGVEEDVDGMEVEDVKAGIEFFFRWKRGWHF
jgi:hypothetical protein